MNIDIEQIKQGIKDQNWKVVGPGLKMAREIAGLTAERLALQMCVTVPTIFRWESGKISIPFIKCNRILSLLDQDSRCGTQTIQTTLLPLKDILNKGYSAIGESDYLTQVAIIKSLFNGTGKTVREVAEATGIAPTYISKVINGRQNSPKKTTKILHFFSKCGVDPNLMFEYSSSRLGEFTEMTDLHIKIDQRIWSNVVMDHEGDLRTFLEQVSEASNPINGKKLIELVYYHAKAMMLLD